MPGIVSAFGGHRDECSIVLTLEQSIGVDNTFL